jgi:beta-barrel assembly-enhancing protease
MKKLVGGNKIYYLFFVPVLIFICKTLFAYQIYDYQTEKFIDKINLEILSVNNYNKKINYKIINDKFPNAFVTYDNTLFISSGLIINCPDYISFLSVLAHEIGHIEKYHVVIRKNEIEDLKKINSIGNIAAIAGSMILQQPELINTIIINQATINNLLINFSQDQEKEADIYSLNTLNKLKLSNNSVREFFKILKDKTNFDLLDEELIKYSTHPSFKERIEILESQENFEFSYINENLQKEFYFIKAKFMAYTNSNFLNNLKGDEKIYYDAITNSLSGELIESLKKLNLLISKNKNNLFFLETKADILLSYGYKKQAIDFYKKVLSKYPKNDYAKFNIFINSNHKNKSISRLKDIFFDNQNLLNLYPNNQILLTKFYDLSKILKLSDWNILFETLLFKKNDIKKKLVELNTNSKDYNLKRIIKLYI